MANVLFTGYKRQMMGDPSLTGFTTPTLTTSLIKATLINTGVYAPVPNTDTNYGAITAGAKVAAATLASKTCAASGANCTFGAATLTFTAVTGAACQVVTIWFDTTVAGTSLLLVNFDTFTSGMPVTPNGGDIVLTWHASGIYQL
jgi:hypothetical protein